MRLGALWTSATVVGTAIVLYWLSLGVAIDVMDNYIPAQIVSGTIPDMSVVNYILGFYTAIILAAIVVPARYMSDDIDVAFRAWVVGILLALVICIFGIAGYPGLTLSADRWVLLPALFTVLVLGNPATFLVIEAVCIIAAYFYLTIKKRLI